MSNIQFTSITTDEGQRFLTVFADGQLLPPVDDSHPNFARIFDAVKASLEGQYVDVQSLVELFDVAKTIETRFERLSDRVAVKNGNVLLDGDPVHGALQTQILDFLDSGEDFAPLVNFYEKLLTNPLGDVREGLYTWIKGQRAEGNFTITEEGDILGYKAVKRVDPEWRTDASEVFVPSRRGEGVVNGRDVKVYEYIEQVPGDVVEMPRSKVLNAPSHECGDGLHIGTYSYAKDFMGSYGTVMLVKFSPRDIVSLPDSNASWKLRVCRYTVIGPVDEPLEVPLYSPQGVEADEEPDAALSDTDLSFDDDDENEEVGTVLDRRGDCLHLGDSVADSDGDEGVVVSIREALDEAEVEYPSNPTYGRIWWDGDDLIRL